MPHALSFNAFNASPLFDTAVPLPEQIDAAGAAGFDLMGIDGGSIARFEAEGGNAATVAAHLAQAGLGCGAITGAGLLGAGPQSSDGLAHAATWAAALGAPFIQVNFGASGSVAEAALEEACRIVAEIAPGVKLAIEYLPFTPLARVADTVALARHVGFDRAGALIDVWHHERGPDSWEDLAAVPLEAIAYVEFDDALPLASDDLMSETLSRRTFPGEGEFDLHRFADVIRGIGYNGPISVEVLSAEWRERDLKVFARRCAESSRLFW
jgi:sugar phosphate isomerase/epimerase